MTNVVTIAFAVSSTPKGKGTAVKEPAPRSTRDKQLLVLIPRKVAMDFRRWKTVEASNIKIVAKVKQVYLLWAAKHPGQDSGTG